MNLSQRDLSGLTVKEKLFTLSLNSFVFCRFCITRRIWYSYIDANFKAQCQPISINLLKTNVIIETLLVRSCNFNWHLQYFINWIQNRWGSYAITQCWSFRKSDFTSLGKFVIFPHDDFKRMLLIRIWSESKCMKYIDDWTII